MKTIRQLREERDWAQLDVAIRLGVTESTISLWERGLRVPTLANQNRLARLFGVNVMDIALGPAEQQPHDAWQSRQHGPGGENAPGP